jgi:dihydropyrimidinase
VHPENDGVINLLREEYRAAGRTGTQFHPLSRPAECEAEAINRMALFARIAGDAPLYIVHLTCALGLEFIEAARRRGQKNLRVETCPQYLFLDESLYSLGGGEGLKYVMCPPLRSPADNAALWQGLNSGIDVVGTDHCPFFFFFLYIMGRDDFSKFLSGAPGIEERIPLMYNAVAGGRLSLRRFTDLCCANPAKIFGMYPRKGVIAAGSDADIVIIDPQRCETITHNKMHCNADYSAYEGMAVCGWPVCTVSRGEVIVRNGEFCGRPGRGKFLKRARRSPAD